MDVFLTLSGWSQSFDRETSQAKNIGCYRDSPPAVVVDAKGGEKVIPKAKTDCGGGNQRSEMYSQP